MSKKFNWSKATSGMCFKLSHTENLYWLVGVDFTNQSYAFFGRNKKYASGHNLYHLIKREMIRVPEKDINIEKYEKDNN